MAKNIDAHPPLVDRITIDGRSIDLTGMDLPAERIRLDPRNPRLVNSVLTASDLSGDELQSFLAENLWADPNVRDLARQIQANKGLTERILVTEDGIVIEGNCRTVVYRKLREQFPQDPTWRRIPARVLPSHVSRRDIAILQGEMHVAGKITWASFEKAGHVYRLHHEYMMTQDEIAHRLRMSKSKVNQFIKAFETMHIKYLRRYPGTAGVHKFSYFEEFFKNPNLRAIASRKPEVIDNFVDWVGTGKIPEGKHVRRLPDILANEAAATALNSGGYLAAMRVLENNNPALTSGLFRALQKATLELEDASATDVEEAQAGGAAEQIVVDLTNALARFRTLSGIEGRQ